MFDRRVPIDPADFLRNLREGDGMPGRVTRYKKAMASTSLAKAVVSSNEMKASAAICTPVVDREMEVILPSGVLTDDYALNPVVLFEHGDGGINKPIATSRNPKNKKLAIYISDEEVSADSWFYDAKINPESAQMFALIDADVIRATSIQAMPLITGQYHDGNSYVPVTESCQLIEWSWCVLGVNPTTLRKSWRGSERVRDAFLDAIELQNTAISKILKNGSVGGDALLPMVRKSLKQVTSRTRTHGVGARYDLETKMTKSLTERQIAEMPSVRRKSLLQNLGEYDPPTRALLKSYADAKDTDDEEEEEEGDDDSATEPDDASTTESETETETETTDEETTDEEPEPEVKSEKKKDSTDGKEVRHPAGASLVKNVYDSTKFLTEWLEDELGPIENPVVRETLGEALAAQKSGLATYEGLYADQYSDYGSLTDDKKKSGSGDHEQEEEENEAVAQMKSLIASSKIEKFKARGLEERVRTLADSAVGPKRKSLLSLQSELHRLADDLARMQKSAAKHTKSLRASNGGVSREEYDALQKKYDELDKDYKSLDEATNTLLKAT